MKKDISMDLQNAYYEEKFKNHFRAAKGSEFQTLFEKLMGLAYPGDFMACRPWGNRGDRKNDGFLRSERCLFQVYAPNYMKEREAITKITEDFKGAKAHWGEHFDKWVFAHNAADGLPPHVIQVILEFKMANPEITLDTWGLPEFLRVFRNVSFENRVSWFGAAPTEDTKARLGFKDLEIVLKDLGCRPFPSDRLVRDVPKGKIEANALSESVATLLKSGMTKAPLVSDFFAQWHDETLGERIATTFRDEYESLRDDRAPDEIFAALQDWSGGSDRGTPEHQMAVLAVIAYFFERCDIFEEPRQPAS